MFLILKPNISKFLDLERNWSDWTAVTVVKDGMEAQIKDILLYAWN